MIYIMEAEIDKCARLVLDGYSFSEKENNYRLSGEHKKEVWNAPKTIFKTKRRRGDFYMYFLKDYAMSRKAYDLLVDFFPPNTEFLDMRNDEKDILAINITEYLDCLNKEKSDITAIYPKFWFKQDVIEGHEIFKVKGYKSENIFVTSKIKKLIEQMGLKGFVFYPVFNGVDEIEHNIWAND